MKTNPNRDASLCDHQTIAQFSHRHGVTLRTIRFYEAAGLLYPERIGTNRYFSAKDSMRMDLTLTAKRFGLSLREIKGLIDAHVMRSNEEPSDIIEIVDAQTMQRQLKALEQQKTELEVALEQLRAARLTL